MSAALQTVPATATADSLPQNLEAEQALLGALLMNNTAYEKISEYLLPEHFYDAGHGVIYGLIGRLLERGQVANPVTLKALCDQEADLQPYGGSKYLVTIAQAVVGAVSIGDYGQLIYDLYLRRQLMGLANETITGAAKISLDISAKDHIETLERHLFDLATTGDQERSYQTFNQAITSALHSAEKAYKREGALSGVSTGLKDLDRLTGGLHPSDLMILAGRPSMGKTSLATNIAFNTAKCVQYAKDEMGKTQVTDGAVCVFFSLEMSAEQLAARILSEQANVPSEKIRRGDMDNAEFDRLIEAAQWLQSLPLFIDDTPALTVSALRTRARRLKRQHNLGFIVVDYLQLMRPPAGMRSDNRVQELSEITRGLKAIAKEINVPVLALSQLSRAVENREDKRPQLSDLRESGSIEQDADMVFFVYREEYYLTRVEPSRRAEESEEKFNERYEAWHKRLTEVANVAEVIVAKQRHGPIGKVQLMFDGSTTKFSDLADPNFLPESH